MTVAVTLAVVTVGVKVDFMISITVDVMVILTVVVSVVLIVSDLSGRLIRINSWYFEAM